MGDLFQEEYGRTVALARFLGADDPEDIAQQAFLNLAARLSKPQEVASLNAYLHTTVVNLTRTGFSRRAMKSRVLRTAAAASRLRGQREHPSAEDEFLASSIPDPMVVAIGELPRAQVEALILRYWLDLTIPQVAEAMGAPLGTAKSHLSRALATLRENFEYGGQADES